MRVSKNIISVCVGVVVSVVSMMTCSGQHRSAPRMRSDGVRFHLLIIIYVSIQLAAHNSMMITCSLGAFCIVVSNACCVVACHIFFLSFFVLLHWYDITSIFIRSMYMI